AASISNSMHSNGDEHGGLEMPLSFIASLGIPSEFEEGRVQQSKGAGNRKLHFRIPVIPVGLYTVV
ncbi:hypothetical protein Ancab_023371, partial [Ancistrocladus abbreviatus]